MTVVLLDSGVANLASVEAAFARLGVPTRRAGRPDETAAASHLVLPGVGSFTAGLGNLRASGLDRVIAGAAAPGVSGPPLVAVCLGLQMLCEGSDEGPGTAGLGIIPGQCRRLPDSVTVPHLGWNRVEPVGSAPGLVTPGTAAFANSYALTEPPPTGRLSWTRHGIRFVSAWERGTVLATQFHPELSGSWGLDLLRRWLARESVVPVPDADSVEGLRHRIIPCLDVQDGRVVKGIRFQGIRDAGDPAECAARYEAQGADELVLLDITASAEARGTRTETVRRVRAALGIPLTVGGGVTSVADARALLAAGADKVSVNTAALRRPALLTELARAFGRQCVVVAIDARRRGEGWEALAVGGREPTGRGAVDWGREAVVAGAGEILLTSWDRDGTRQGADLELLRVMTEAVPVPVIASGGIGEEAHAAEAFRAGADAVLAASIFHDGDHTVEAVKARVAAQGVRVRR